jgi:Kazal-type serine protease inhibitor domain
MLRKLPIVAAGILIVWACSIQDADARIGQRCGGIAGIRCDHGLWCEPPPGQCGVIDTLGKCVKIPQLCPKLWRPVCGCDRNTYSNDCERQRQKVPKDRDGKC